MKQAYREKIYNFEVPKLDSASLMVKAIELEEWFSGQRLDIAFMSDYKIHHIMVNYIRHQTVKNYNKHAATPQFKTNPEEYFYWFKAINHEIGQIYPFLRGTIAQQISHKRKKIFTQAQP